MVDEGVRFSAVNRAWHITHIFHRLAASSGLQDFRKQDLESLGLNSNTGKSYPVKEYLQREALENMTLE
jgi:hypothetical protein